MKLFAIIVSLMMSAAAWANLPMSPSRYISVNGLNIAVYESSGRRGPGILMIHGNTSSAQYYTRVMKSAFARQYKVYAIDLPGYGHSQNNPGGYTFGFWASTIAQAAQQLQTDDGVLVGWSLGGDLSFQSMHLLPNLKGVFVFGTAPVGADPNLPPAFLSPAQSYAGQAVTYGAVPNLTVQQVTDYVTAFFRPNYPVPSFAVPEGVRTDPNTRQAIANVINGTDATFQDEVAIVRNTTIPLAILYPSKDAFLNPQFLFDLAPSLPTLWQDKIIVVKNSGHATQWELPNKFISLLKKFVKDVE